MTRQRNRLTTLGNTSALALLVTVMACGPTDPGGGGGGGGEDASNNGQPDAYVSTQFDSGGDTEFFDANPNIDSGCGQQEENIELISVPPDVLIVLDRSGSMGSFINIFNPLAGTRWDVMGTSLKNIVQTTDNSIRWGLSVFPTDADCGVSTGTEVAIGLNASASISSWLNGNSPDGNTPAHLGLQQALTTFQNTPTTSEERFVLFATDGVPNCAGSSDEANTQTIAAINALTAAGIKTYVIGFGDPLGLDTQLLNEAAQAGGTARPSTPYYYEASDATQLQMALDQISGGVVAPSCSYELSSLPPDPEAVTVKVDGAVVPRSTNHTNGWDYFPDASTITFFGSYCSQIEAGSVSSVEFLFGCPGPIID